MHLFIAGIFFALGAILASLVCVIAERIFTGQSWLAGRSRCNSCRRELAPLDLVPIFSLLLSRGRCRTCHARIPLMYSLYEFALGVVFAAAYLTIQRGLTSLETSLQLFVFLVAILVLFFIVVYDLRHTLVPWSSSIALVILALIFAWLRAPTMREFEVTLLIAAGIGLFFFLMHALSRGRWMGLGDAPVAFALSLLVGGAAIPGLLFSFWIGAAIGVLILALRRGGPTMGIEIPFVPFLALGYLLAFFTQWNPLMLTL
jgi:prepilin signal peptidase PulO-like enzyme (type II secretory pathway)